MNRETIGNLSFQKIARAMLRCGALIAAGFMCVTLFTPRVVAQGPCCGITAINLQTGIVTAKVNTTGQVFEFKVTNPALVQSVKVGEAIYANFKAGQVSVDGKTPCGTIVSMGPAKGPLAPAAPGKAPATPPVPSEQNLTPKPPSPVQPGASGPPASGANLPCCAITEIGLADGIVTAKVNATSQGFEFKVMNKVLLQSLKVGQGVYANFKAQQVSLDGVTPCCQIVTLGAAKPAPVPPTTRPTPSGQVPGGKSPTPRRAETKPPVALPVGSVHPAGQVWPFLQASGGSGTDVANELIALPWPGLSKQYVKQTVQTLKDLTKNPLPIASGRGSVGIDVSGVKAGADWHYKLTLRDLTPFVDLNSGPPGFRYASLTGEAGNPPGFVIRAPLSGHWNFGINGTLHLDAGIDDHVGQSLDWSADVIALSIGVSNFSVTGGVQLDSREPDRPTFVKADMSPELTLNFNGVQIPIALTFEPKPGSISLKGGFASVPIRIGAALNTRLTGDTALTIAPRNRRGDFAATVSLKGYLEIDLINPVNNQNLTSAKVDLLTLNIPFDIPALASDMQSNLAMAFMALQPPLPRTWPPPTISQADPPGSDPGQMPPPPNPLPDFGGVAQQIEAAIDPAHMPYGAILMLDKAEQGPPQSGSRGAPQYQLHPIARGRKLSPVSYGRLADSAIWTGHYLAAESFRYAATNDPAALSRVQEIIQGIRRLLDITSDAVGQNCKDGLLQNCQFFAVNDNAKGRLLARSVLPDSSPIPWTLDHGLQGWPPQMLREDGTTPCFYLHPDGGWQLGSRKFATYSDALRAMTSSAGRQTSIQVVIGNLQLPQPVPPIWYGIGCGKDHDDDVVSRDQYDGIMMGLGFAYQLVPPVQSAATELVDRLLGYLVTQNQWNLPAPPDYQIMTTWVGNFDMQLDFLRIGATVDPGMWNAAYQRFKNASAASWIPVWATTLDPFSSYFGFNLGQAEFAPALFLEQQDPAVRQNMMAAYSIMWRATSRHHNPYYELVRILVEQQAQRNGIASGPAPSNPNIPLSAEITSLLSQWIERWQIVKAPDGMPTNKIPRPQDIEALWRRPEHVGVYTSLDGKSQQILSTFALPVQSRVGDADYLWEDPPFLTGVHSGRDPQKCEALLNLPPSTQELESCASAADREGAAIDYLLPYWMSVYLGLLK